MLGDAILIPNQMGKNASPLSENEVNAPIFEITSVQVSLLSESLQFWQKRATLDSAVLGLILIGFKNNGNTSVSTEQCVCQLGMPKSTSIFGHFFGFWMVARFPTACQGERRVWVRGYQERQKKSTNAFRASVLTASLELSCPYKYHTGWQDFIS